MSMYDIDIIRAIFSVGHELYYLDIRIKTLGWASCLNQQGDWQYFQDMNLDNFSF